MIVVGGSKRDRRKMERTERTEGEIWHVEGEEIRGRKGDGWKADVSGSKRMRLTAKAMMRIAHGLDEPFGDG